jgi:predicted transcriptional regulator
MADETQDNLRTLVAEVAAAYFANSHVGVGEIAAVIGEITKSLAAVAAAPSGDNSAGEAEAAPSRRLTPAQIRRSIAPDAIVSFEDGRPYKTLRRHLSVRGLTPEQYREKWGLPNDYPMVAPAYSERRSQMAKELGLGARGRRAAAPGGARRRRSSKSAADQ